MDGTPDPRSSGREYRCTLVIPTFNAADFAEATVTRVANFLKNHSDWCVIFVVDGCPYGTAEKLRPLVQPLAPQVQLESYQPNRGKGYALRLGLNLAKTPYLIYTDVDLAYDPDEAVKILNLLENGADMGVVNRASPDSRFLISPLDFPRIYKRHLMSRGFNWWLRQMLPIKILDTQAGLKGLTARAWEIIGPQMTSDGFFFDVEFLARAGAARMRIDEIPVFVKYVDPTTVRMVTHGWAMMKDTVRLRKNLQKNAKKATVAIPSEKTGIGMVGTPAKPL
jgi:dolichyl-phosphate beta-glucosyltransferase